MFLYVASLETLEHSNCVPTFKHHKPNKKRFSSTIEQQIARKIPLFHVLNGHFCVKKNCKN